MGVDYVQLSYFWLWLCLYVFCFGGGFGVRHAWYMPIPAIHCCVLEVGREGGRQIDGHGSEAGKQDPEYYTPSSSSYERKQDLNVGPHHPSDKKRMLIRRVASE